jgi:uncharacterized membrane protein
VCLRRQHNTAPFSDEKSDPASFRCPKTAQKKVLKGELNNMAASEAPLKNHNTQIRQLQRRDATGAGKQDRENINVGQTERWASTIGGGVLAVYGLTRGSMGGLVLALVGGSLVYRGTTGHCNVYEAAGINTADKYSGRNPAVSVSGNRGIKVEKSVMINKSPEELYRFWHNFENLPRFMRHLESVKNTGADGKRTHWVAKAPMGTTVEWDAEVINDKPNELIAWRSLENADVDNAGSVRFASAPAGHGSIVKVSLEYDPPGGVVGATIAKLFGEEPAQQIEEDLRRFKQIMEAGEILTTEGQSSGRSSSASSGK